MRLPLTLLIPFCLPLACPAPSIETPTLPLEARRKALSDDLRAIVRELEAAGRYDCCIQKPCKLCAIRAGGCRCGDAARDGEPVCEECAHMWLKGQGAEPVEPSTIRSFLEAERLANGDYGAICGPLPTQASSN